MILIDSISFAWQKDQPLFNGFSLSLTEGEIHGIAGLNGAGKTTLLNILASYLKPDHGHISINGNKPRASKSPFWKQKTFSMPISPAGNICNCLKTNTLTTTPGTNSSAYPLMS